MKFPSCAECGTRLIPEMMHCPHCGAAAGHPLPTEVRCECGFLLCKLTEEALEVKCRRCKRLVFIPFADLDDRFEDGKRKMKEWQARPPVEAAHEPAPKGQYCSSCGQVKPNVVYGKCLECRTEFIKVQYKSRPR